MSGKKVRLALAFAVAGCAPAWLKGDLPAGYVQLREKGGYLRRAVSADGVALGLKVEKNKPEASAAFWTKVVQRYLKESQGYVPVKLTVDGATRAAGWKVFEFSLPAEEKLLYLLALRLSLNEKKLDIVEAAGPDKAVKADEKKLLRYLSSLRRE